MAFKRFVRYAYALADRCDRQNRPDLSSAIRKELWLYSWTKTDILISIGCDIALASHPDGTLEQLLPLIVEWPHLTEAEIKAHPRIQELFDYSKRLNKIERKDL